MAWQGRLDPDRRGPSGRGQLRHGRFGLAWKSGAWQVEAWHGRRGSSWHGRPSLGMAWQAWMCGARHDQDRPGVVRSGMAGVVFILNNV